MAKRKNPTQGERLNKIEVGLARVEQDVKWLKKGMVWIGGVIGSLTIALIINFAMQF